MDAVDATAGTGTEPGPSNYIKLGLNPASEEATIFCKPRVQRTAIFFGYVGSGYQGSQLNLQTARGGTVEQELMDALYKAGGIRQNIRYNEKALMWTRSSRTDKQAHALQNVVSTDLLVPQLDAWETDPFGVKLADCINAHLPDAVEVFGVVKVPKSFHARVFCKTRTYEYLIPAWVLGQDGSPADEVRLIKLNAALEMFVGRRAFHNFTRRTLYQNEANSSRRAKASARVVREWQDLVDEEARAEAAGGSRAVHSFGKVGDEPFFARDADPGSPLVVWKHECDPGDTVVASLYRNVVEASCEQVAWRGPALPCGSKSVLRMRFSADSFVLNQIRHMVATSLLVVRAGLPIEFLNVALAPPARVQLPMVPADTLTLVDAVFNQPARCPYKVQLELEGEALERQIAFKDRVLSRSLSESLSKDLWGPLVDRFEHRYEPLLRRPSEMEHLLATYSDWFSRFSKTSGPSE